MYDQPSGVHTRSTARRSRTVSSAETVVRRLLERADIRVNGDRPWDLHVRRPGFYARLLAGGELALGESYMDGWWDCDAIDALVARALRARLRDEVGSSLRTRLRKLLAVIMNRQSRSRAFDVGAHHYDLGNDLFEVMLDRRLTYSCAYWKDATTLDDAQEAKLDLICRKLDLKPGQHVLDIGSGWGSFMAYAADHYGAQATGITVSRAQANYVRERLSPASLDVHVHDYRAHVGTYDNVVSVGMFEHVGVKNYRTFMEVAHRCLRDGGLFLIQTIVTNRSSRIVDAWTEKYIFPNGMLPSPMQIAEAVEGLFVVEDVHNFGADYDPTLRSWHRNFVDGWRRLAGRYTDRFFRMWTYYLLSSAGAFRAREIGLWQIVLSKKGVPGGYSSVR